MLANRISNTFINLTKEAERIHHETTTVHQPIHPGGPAGITRLSDGHYDVGFLLAGTSLERCEFGTLEAAKKGRWKYIGTSNFCGPLFAGMWRKVEWHKQLTGRIKASRLDPGLEG